MNNRMNVCLYLYFLIRMLLYHVIVVAVDLVWFSFNFPQANRTQFQLFQYFHFKMENMCEEEQETHNDSFPGTKENKIKN